MTRLSMSNLAWSEATVESIAPRLRAAGIEGVEIAPTAIWPEAPRVTAKDARKHSRRWHDNGLDVSGIQSLLYGHPELQLLHPETWPAMHSHLTAMIELAHELGTHIAVFGSPRNRIRGNLESAAADRLAIEFFHSLVPVLVASGVTLTLEPNAPAYGADYLIRYTDVVALSEAIGSRQIQPQVDTGCLLMVGEDPVRSIGDRAPAHVHISAPHLLPPPGPVKHELIADSLKKIGYEGWIVLEMLQAPSNPLGAALEAAEWFASTYSSRDDVPL